MHYVEMMCGDWSNHSIIVNTETRLVLRQKWQEFHQIYSVMDQLKQIVILGHHFGDDQSYLEALPSSCSEEETGGGGS
jgi:hypothetical protein